MDSKFSDANVHTLIYDTKPLEEPVCILFESGYICLSAFCQHVRYASTNYPKVQHNQNCQKKARNEKDDHECGIQIYHNGNMHWVVSSVCKEEIIEYDSMQPCS